MKTLTTPLLTVALITTILAPNTPAQTTPSTEGILRGRLEFREDKDMSWMVIVVDKPITLMSTSGERLSTKELQIAGLNQKNWKQAAALQGQMVQAKGSLMEAHTRYHKTPILILTKKVDPL